MTADLGSGLWLTDRDRCQQSLLDGDTGKPPAPELVWRGNYDYGAFADPLQPSPPRFCVLTGHLRLWHRGMALLWTGSKNPGGGVLVAEAPGETPQHRWSIDGAEFRILRIDGNDVTFFRAFPHSGLLRVRPSSGAIIWQRELADACDPYEDRFVQLIRRDGIPSAALIQSCRQTQLVELPSGQVRWTRPTAGAMALLREIDPLDIGTPFPWQAVVLPNRNSKGQRSIRLFSSDGRSTEGPPLPADLAGVVAVPGGLILTRADGVQMVRHSGQAVWELAGAQHNSLRSGDYFLVQQGDPKNGLQVVIEIASGRAFLISHGPIRPLQQPVAARGLWLSVLDNPRTPVAWDLTAAANEKTSVVEGRAP